MHSISITISPTLILSSDFVILMMIVTHCIARGSAHSSKFVGSRGCTAAGKSRNRVEPQHSLGGKLIHCVANRQKGVIFSKKAAPVFECRSSTLFPLIVLSHETKLLMRKYGRVPKQNKASGVYSKYLISLLP